jgi:hypothetical protein
LILQDVQGLDVVFRHGVSGEFVLNGIKGDWTRRRPLGLRKPRGCLKHSIHGDFCLASFDEVASLARNGADGRVLR